jgi:hypothetical protein
MSDENIYKAIYALESYVSERELLSEEDFNLYLRLKDKFDFQGTVKEVVSKCKNTLGEILGSKDILLEVNVCFKLKKWNSTDNIVEYRPLHTSCLVNQICMASMLMPLMFDDSSGKRNLSELSRMIPHNFFGNIPSCNVRTLFMSWKEKYRQYSQTVTNRSKEYAKTKEYDCEISFDLKDFFPSVNPLMILDLIWGAISGKYNLEEDKETLKMVITKLLYFKIPEKNLEGWKDVYYKKDMDKVKPLKGYYPVRGIAQGLPQSYFFGNLCMIEVADKMNRLKELEKTDSFFYVDDSVVFARDVDVTQFEHLIENLNESVASQPDSWKVEPLLNGDLAAQARGLSYKVEFHLDGKSTICKIEDSFKGMEGLYLVQRPISMGGWIKGNIDEVDDNVALKKLNALKNVVDIQIKKIGESVKEDPGREHGYDSRLKWLRRYRRYFLFRQKRLQILLNGAYDEELKKEFLETFKIDEFLEAEKPSEEFAEALFKIFEEDIFKSELELILNDMPQEGKAEFCGKIKDFDKKISEYPVDNGRNTEFLYYHRICSLLEKTNVVTVSGYESLARVVQKVRPFRSTDKFIETLREKSVHNDEVWNSFSFLKKVVGTKDGGEHRDVEREFPEWCGFIFHNSENFKRMILNCCFSSACNILAGDNLSILRMDIKPVKYYELRVISMLRNSCLKMNDFFEFLRSFDYTDINERMDIDLGVLESLGIFRQRVQSPDNIDRLIQTHRLVKSLWHNGSKFLNAYTLHNQEHAINLIKNVVRLVNNIDYLNLKASDYFLLFNACYLHDISMVIHPSVASFNDSNAASEQLISKWLRKMVQINNHLDGAFKGGEFNTEQVHSVREELGLTLVGVFQDVFDFFEDRVRGPHAGASAKYIRCWQEGMLSFLTKLEADAIATVSDSHGWDITDVYELKSSAKEELVSLKYMMILIRLADLLDMANDRIDYFLLKQNRSQMNAISRYHWISHLITDRYELDVDYEPEGEKGLTEQPIKENIHLDIFLNTEILVRLKSRKGACRGINASICMRKQKRHRDGGVERECLEYRVGLKNEVCSTLREEDGDFVSCPFICLWMSNKHRWLFFELGKLKHYLNSVNSKLFKTDITVRFYYNNNHKLDSEFYDDVKELIIDKDV